MDAPYPNQPERIDTTMAAPPLSMASSPFPSIFSIAQQIAQRGPHDGVSSTASYPTQATTYLQAAALYPTQAATTNPLALAFQRLPNVLVRDHRVHQKNARMDQWAANVHTSTDPRLLWPAKKTSLLPRPPQHTTSSAFLAIPRTPPHASQLGRNATPDTTSRFYSVRAAALELRALIAAKPSALDIDAAYAKGDFAGTYLTSRELALTAEVDGAATGLKDPTTRMWSAQHPVSGGRATGQTKLEMPRPERKFQIGVETGDWTEEMIAEMTTAEGLETRNARSGVFVHGQCSAAMGASTGISAVDAGTTSQTMSLRGAYNRDVLGCFHDSALGIDGCVDLALPGPDFEDLPELAADSGSSASTGKHHVITPAVDVSSLPWMNATGNCSGERAIREVPLPGPGFEDDWELGEEAPEGV